MSTAKKPAAETQSPGDALAAELEQRVDTFDYRELRSFSNHLIGGLTEAMASMPGGPEKYIECLDRAAEYAKEAWS